LGCVAVRGRDARGVYVTARTDSARTGGATAMARARRTRTIDPTCNGMPQFAIIARANEE